MALPDESKIYRVPGRLCVGPTDPDLSGTYPFGGTALGTIHAVKLQPVSRGFEVTAEEYGLEVVESLYQGRQWVMAGLVRGWDDDTLSTMFPNTFAGATSGDQVISEPGGVNPGGRLSGEAVKLVFAPNDSRFPGWIMYRAIPQLDVSASLNFHVIQELTFLVTFLGVRDAAGRAISIGQMEDLSV